MSVPAAAQRLLDSLDRCAFAPGDDDLLRERKRFTLRFFLPLSLIYGVTWTINLSRLALGHRAVGPLAVFNLFAFPAALAPPASLIASGRLSRAVCDAALAALSAGVILADWSQQAFSQSYWAMQVVVLDAMLVLGSSHRLSLSVVALTLLWFVVLSTDMSWGWGLLAVVPDSDMNDPTRRHKPTGNPKSAILFTVFQGAILAFDFGVTRTFSIGLRRHAEEIAASAAAAEAAAVMLAAYDTEGAGALLSSRNAGRLPPRLAGALRDIVSNLVKYKPFLPQSVLHGGHGHGRGARGARDSPARGSAESSDEESVTRSAVLPACLDTGSSSIHSDSWESAHSSMVSEGYSEYSPRCDATGYGTDWGTPEKETAQYSGASLLNIEPGGSPMSAAGSERKRKHAPVSPTPGASASMSKRDLRVTFEPSRGSAKGGPSSPIKRMGSNVGSVASSRRLKHAGSVNSSRNAKPSSTLHSEPQRKAVTLLAVNRCGFLAAIDEHPAAQVTAWLCDALQHFAKCCVDCRGVMDHMCGDHGWGSFGAARLCVDHRLCATRCAELFATWRRPDLLGDIVSTSAICAGGGFAGDFGNSVTQRFMIVGGLVLFTNCVERVAAAAGVPLLANGLVWAAVEELYHTRLHMQILHRKCGDDRPLFLWELESVKKKLERKIDHSDGEWMYTLSNRLPNKWNCYNGLVMAWVDGNTADAKQKARNELGSCALHQELLGSDPVLRALSELLSRVDGGAPPPSAVVSDVWQAAGVAPRGGAAGVPGAAAAAAAAAGPPLGGDAGVTRLFSEHAREEEALQRLRQEDQRRQQQQVRQQVQAKQRKKRKDRMSTRGLTLETTTTEGAPGVDWEDTPATNFPVQSAVWSPTVPGSPAAASGSATLPQGMLQPTLPLVGASSPCSPVRSPVRSPCQVPISRESALRRAQALERAYQLQMSDCRVDVGSSDLEEQVATPVRMGREAARKQEITQALKDEMGVLMQPPQQCYGRPLPQSTPLTLV